jgi:hypothetical protein
MADCIRRLPDTARTRVEPQCPPLSELERARLAAALSRMVLGAWELRSRRRAHRRRPAKDRPPNLGEHVV